MSTRELHARANRFELHGRRSPRDGRLTRAARQCACARSLSTQSFRPAAPSVLAARQLSGSRRQSGVRRPICTWWAIHAVAARRPRATGSVFGMNSGVTQRAGELAAADPAHRARLGRRLQLDARSRMEKLPRGAPFEIELETAIDHGVLGGRGCVPCADTAPDRRFRVWCHASLSWCHNALFWSCELVSRW